MFRNCGIRPQQLRARQRRLRATAGRRAAIAEERVRQLLVERRRSERQVLRIELVDVDRGVVRAAERQVVAARADVADGDRLAARQLALEVRPSTAARAAPCWF